MEGRRSGRPFHLLPPALDSRCRVMNGGRGNAISVAVRVRPNLARAPSGVHEVPDSVKKLKYPSSVVVGSDQQSCFEAIGAPLLAKMDQGYSTTLLAYGQTGSGKTYTMFGPTGSLTEASLGGSDIPVDWGLFPRLALSMLSKCKNLKASAIEVYNNAPYDLLGNRKPLKMSRSQNAGRDSLGVRTKASGIGGGKFSSRKVGMNGEHPSTCTCHDCYKAKQKAKEQRKLRLERAPSVSEGLRGAKRVSSVKHGDDGSSARTVGETLMTLCTSEDVARFSRQIEASRVAHSHALNERSSRSHCLVKLFATYHFKDTLIQQCFTFVDLAGSERIQKSEVKGQRMHEAIGINDSLTVLGCCLRDVQAGKKHTRWRDKVVTRLLRNSFENKKGAGTYTAVVVNVSPEHEDETVCTLRFGGTVAGILNKSTVIVGQRTDGEIRKLTYELEDLRLTAEKMKREGLAGGFLKDCVKTERESLEANMRKLERMEQDLNALKIKLVETGGNSVALSGKIEAKKKEVYVQKMLVLRQQSIRTLWKDPSPVYKTVVAEINEKEQQLHVISGNMSSSNIKK